MPYALVHLAVALEAHRPQPPSPAFLLGSIAPDAIHARPGADRTLKRHTHLRDREGEWPAPLRAWLSALPYDDAISRDLVRGYAAHLLADRLWSATVVDEFHASVPPELPRPEVDRLYYAEMDLIECALYRTLPWRPAVTDALAGAPAGAIPGLISIEEVDSWRWRTLTWWPEMEARASGAPMYASAARVLAFVCEAATLVRDAAHTWAEW